MLYLQNCGNSITNNQCTPYEILQYIGVRSRLKIVDRKFACCPVNLRQIRIFVLDYLPLSDMWDISVWQSNYVICCCIIKNICNASYVCFENVFSNSLYFIRCIASQSVRSRYLIKNKTSPFVRQVNKCWCTVLSYVCRKWKCQ